MSATAAATVASGPIVVTDEPLLFSTAEICFIVNPPSDDKTSTHEAYLPGWAEVSASLAPFFSLE